MAPGARLEVEIEEKRFADLREPLFTGLRFRVAPASILVLVGPSGIGKSSLLRLIAGIDRDFTGRIRVDGTPAARASPPGFVFQDPRLLPWLGAGANICAVNPTIAPSRATRFLGEVGLAGFEDALPHELSGGMQRRVALARALATAPRLLLLDEPFVSLDQALVQELQALFLGIIADYRPTVILVSHSVQDAARLGDRVLVLGGRPAAISSEMELTPPRDARGARDVDGLVHALTDRMEAAP